MYNLSIIIPSYNNKELLIRCLKSIKNEINSDDEVIIVDDGSTDGTYEYIKEKYNKEVNIKIVSQKNSGSGAARNRGIGLSNNEYLWFVDADDFIVPGAVNTIKKQLNSNHTDILFFDYYLNYIKKDEHVALQIDPSDKTNLMISFHVPWNKIFKRTLFTDIAFPTDKIRYQDHGTIPAAIGKGEDISYIKEPLYVYNYSQPNNISKKKNKNNDMYIAFQNLIKYWKKGYLQNSEIEVLFIYTFVFSQIYNSSSDDWKSIASNVKKVKEFLTDKYPDWKNSKYLKWSVMSKYSATVEYLPLKVCIGNILKNSTFVPSLMIFFYKKLKSI